VSPSEILLQHFHRLMLNTLMQQWHTNLSKNEELCIENNSVSCIIFSWSSRSTITQTLEIMWQILSPVLWKLELWASEQAHFKYRGRKYLALLTCALMESRNIRGLVPSLKIRWNYFPPGKKVWLLSLKCCNRVWHWCGLFFMGEV